MSEKTNDKKNNKTPEYKKRIDNLSVIEKIKIILAFTIIFSMLFFIMYRNSKISEAFSEINSIKSKITKIEKENNQLEVSIQSSLNLYNVEQSAKDLLGMQKLTNSQTIYINLPKKDYIEASVEAVEIDEESFIDTIKDKVIEFFE